ncbi:MAG TPA: alpha-amylase family protein [Terriglobia bacterium]|nr:alpha-amylase family protein [Terriglobia bacterium]
MIKFDRRKFVQICTAGATLAEFPRSGPGMGMPGRKNVGHEGAPAAASAEGSSDWKQFSTAYFTYPAFAQKITVEQIKGKVSDAVSLGAQVLMFFVIHEGYALYKSDVVERYPFATDFDVLAKVAAECKANGLKLVPCWMGMYGIGLQVEQHPGWLQVSFDGKRKDNLVGNSMCLRSPFQYLLAQQVKEIITRYQVDGVYFDGLCQLSGYCYCQYCQTEFRARYGREIPKDPDDPTFFKFRLDATTEIIQELRAAIDQFNPSVLLFLNAWGIETYYSVGLDLVRLGEYVDVFTLESLWEATGVPIWKVGMQKQLMVAETRRPVWYPRWIARNADNDLACVPAATIKVWAGESMVNAESPVAVEQDAFDVDRSQFPTLQECLGRVREVVPYLRDARRLRNVALLHSVATKEFVYPRKNERAYMDNLEGMNSALLSQHVPFEIVTERDIEAGLDKKRFKALILANAMCLSDSTLKSIADFVSAGGGLLATYRSSMLNEKGEERKEMGLAELLGIETMGLEVRPGGGEGGTAASGREATNWYRVLEGSPIGKGLEGRNSTFDGGMVKIRTRGTATVVAQALDYNYRKQATIPTAWWPWWPGQPGLPLIVAHEGGRVIYFAGELDAAYLRWGWPEIAQLIANAVRSVAGPPPIEVEGPTSVQAEVYESAAMRDGFVCVVSNRSTNPLFPRRGGADQHWITEVIPVSHVKIRVAVPAARIREVTTITKQRVEAEVQSGLVHLTVPLLAEYEVVFVRW